MMDAIFGVLARARPDERAELAQWGAGRLMLALARERGFAHAAGHAYRMADALAGVAVR